MAAIRLATLGDSITANPGFGGVTSWPEVLLPLLDLGSTLANYAVSGYNTNQLLPIFEASIRNGAFDALAVMAGINDLRSVGAITKEQTIANLRTMWTEATAAGKKVVVFTISPHKGEIYDDTIYGDLWNPTLQADQEWINALIRSDAAAHGYGLVEAYGALGSPGDAAVMNPSYGNADGIHLNQAGENLLATLARAGITTAFSPPVPVGSIEGGLYFTANASASFYESGELAVAVPGGVRYLRLVDPSSATPIRILTPVGVKGIG